MSKKIGATVGALVVGLTIAASAAAQGGPTQTGASRSGQDLFRTYCAACHGQGGTGNGPVASSLRKPPADLTLFARRNDGMFSPELVYRIVDGRDPVAGHGGGDMPIWGDAFSRTREGANEETVKERIQAIVSFLQSIQKPAAPQ